MSKSILSEPQFHNEEAAYAYVEARRAARLDKGVSARTVRVPWQGTLCVPCQVEFRSRLVESGSTGAP